MRRNNCREKEEGREGGREERDSKKKAGKDTNQARIVVLGTYTHRSHRSIHINRQGATHTETEIHTHRDTQDICGEDQRDLMPPTLGGII